MIFLIILGRFPCASNLMFPMSLYLSPLLFKINLTRKSRFLNVITLVKFAIKNSFLSFLNRVFFPASHVPTPLLKTDMQSISFAHKHASFPSLSGASPFFLLGCGPSPRYASPKRPSYFSSSQSPHSVQGAISMSLWLLLAPCLRMSLLSQPRCHICP